MKLARIPVLLVLSGSLLATQKTAEVEPRTQAIASRKLARNSIDQSVAYLIESQNGDGSWNSSTVESLLELGFSPETFHSWRMAGVALASMALMAVEPTPATEVAAKRALHWLSTTRMPKRGSDWDIDNNWASLYCFQAFVQAAADPRFADSPWRDQVRTEGLEFYKLLERNQEPLGGWGYYEGPVVSARPTWSTSFSTACVIPALIQAKTLEWPIKQSVIDKAVAYVHRCRLPKGGYEYDLRPVPRISGGEHINRIKGSLGRIQVCNWALHRAGHPAITTTAVREGLSQFFEHHAFLDAARMKPIPHESYYYNAGYFYLFGHCYAGEVINELPEPEREQWHQKLRPHLIKIQWEDGSSVDFPGSGYLWIAGTSFSILALQAGLY